MLRATVSPPNSFWLAPPQPRCLKINRSVRLWKCSQGIILFEHVLLPSLSPNVSTTSNGRSSALSVTVIISSCRHRRCPGVGSSVLFPQWYTRSWDSVQYNASCQCMLRRRGRVYYERVMQSWKRWRQQLVVPGRLHRSNLAVGLMSKVLLRYQHG